MDIHQLRTFVAVARERSITQASKQLHLSQPAVSAHIKAIEEALGLALFERTSRGMLLTADGQRLLARAEQTLAAHQELMAEATRSRGRLTGRLRLGAGSNSDHQAVGRLLTTLAERCPGVEVSLKHGTSQEILTGLRAGHLDAGFYNEAGVPAPDLTAVEVARFSIHVVAAPALLTVAASPDWSELAGLAWVYPTTSACCGQTAESLFRSHRVRPRRIIDVDRQDLTLTLVTSGIGVGLLHEGAARAAAARGQVALILEAPAAVRVLFAHLASRAEDPLLTTATSILRAGPVP